MLEYIIKALTALAMGFFPYLEIYVAVPAALAMGLDGFSAVFWSGLGNFFAVPLIVFFYSFLTRFPRLDRWLSRLYKNKHQNSIEKYGNFFIILMTPLVGIWVTAVIARFVGFPKVRLFLCSFCSIYIYGTLMAVLTILGFDLLN